MKAGGGTGAPTQQIIVKYRDPAPVTTLTVPVLLEASDGTGGSGIADYFRTPAAFAGVLMPTAPGWRATPPTRYTFTSKGVNSVTAWVKGAAGNITGGR